MQTSQHRLGLEQEYFLFREDGRVPAVEDMSKLFSELSSLKSSMSTQPRTDGNSFFALSRQDSGSVQIHNDFCTHILELSFSPCTSYAEFNDLYQRVHEVLRSAIVRSGLILRSGAYFDISSDEVVFVHPCDATTASRYTWLKERQVPSREFSRPLFNAMMTATHVHVETRLETLTPRLPALYEVEYLSPLLFSNSTSMSDGQHIHCLRPLMWRDAFPDVYLAAAFPAQLPSTLRDYKAFLDSTEGFVRDYTFICPRPNYGTVEFRSTCSQPNLDNLEALLGFRILAMLRARLLSKWSSIMASRLHFFEVCRNGFQAALQDFDLHAQQLSAAYCYCPKEWQVCADSFQEMLSVRRPPQTLEKAHGLPEAPQGSDVAAIAAFAPFPAETDQD